MKLDPVTGRIDYHRVIRYPEVSWWRDPYPGPLVVEHPICPGSNLWPCLP